MHANYNFWSGDWKECVPNSVWDSYLLIYFCRDIISGGVENTTATPHSRAVVPDTHSYLLVSYIILDKLFCSHMFTLCSVILLN